MGKLLGVSEAASAGGREDDPGWKRDIPPNETQQYELAKVCAFLDRGGDVDCTTVSPLGHTMLVTACINNHECLVAELVRRGGALDVKAKGKTALHYACLLAHPNCAKILLDAGARTDIRVDEDDTDFTEADGMTVTSRGPRQSSAAAKPPLCRAQALEIVQDKLLGKRDPEAERLRELLRLLQR
jgi:ankyrin repeat protein